MNFTCFNALSPATLKTLAQALHDGALSRSGSYHSIEQIAGAGAGALAATISELENQGLTRPQIGILVSAITETRQQIPDPSLVFELVLSGPPVFGIPTRQTAAVVQSLFAEAKEDVLVVGYAVYQGDEMFAPLPERMLSIPELQVRFSFDIRRKEHTQIQDVISDFAKEFTTRHWPWPELPALYYYPRSLDHTPSNRGSLHAKCVIVDRQKAFITSANFTEAAQNRNIEAGVLFEYAPMVLRLWHYFDRLIATGYFKKTPLRFG